MELKLVFFKFYESYEIKFPSKFTSFLVIVLGVFPWQVSLKSEDEQVVRSRK